MGLSFSELVHTVFVFWDLPGDVLAAPESALGLDRCNTSSGPLKKPCCACGPSEARIGQERGLPAFRLPVKRSGAGLGPMPLAQLPPREGTARQCLVTTQSQHLTQQDCVESTL